MFPVVFLFCRNVKTDSIRYKTLPVQLFKTKFSLPTSISYLTYNVKYPQPYVIMWYNDNWDYIFFNVLTRTRMGNETYTSSGVQCRRNWVFPDSSFLLAITWNVKKNTPQSRHNTPYTHILEIKSKINLCLY